MLSTIVARGLVGIAFLGIFQGSPLPFDVRARQELLFGKGQGEEGSYYDVVITRQPEEGVAIKLPYTSKGGKFYFDLHHRIDMKPDFAFPAEVTTVVEVITGGTNSLGRFTISETIDKQGETNGTVVKVSTAPVDRYVVPVSTKTVTLNTQPGPQSISIVGRSQTISRNGAVARVEAPGARIAVVSNFRFEDASQVNPLKKTTP
ncbi:MAG TPA: hypothetical protein VFY29_07510 [Terriglobia bacterium]|nr:hypothetical protein [Terriglobia bacterium]